MENENLAYWNKHRAVPNNATKPFNNGKFQGTDINTMWRLKCLTEDYGQCGFGWYYTIKDKQVVECKNGDMFAFVEIELFLKGKDGNWSMPISGSGGNKIARVTKDGALSTSDEAFKMATTDAIGVACRNLGIGADIYWENDKTKYIYTDESGVTSYSKESLATAEQIARIRELKCIEPNICARFKVDKIEQLTQSEANDVIKLKEQSLK